MGIHENVVYDGAIDDEYDQRERESISYTPAPPYHSQHIPASPAYTIHFFGHFAGTSSGAMQATLDGILNKTRDRNATYLERDNMIYAMHQ